MAEGLEAASSPACGTTCRSSAARPQKRRDLLAHAPRRLHADEIKADFDDMVHAGTHAEVVAKRKVFLGQVEAALSPPSPTAWRRLVSACSRSCATRPSSQALGQDKRNAIERFPRSSSAGSRPSACCPAPSPLPCSSGPSSRPVQITMRRVNRWQTLEHSPTDLDLTTLTHPTVQHQEPLRHPDFHQLRDTT